MRRTIDVSLSGQKVLRHQLVAAALQMPHNLGAGADFQMLERIELEDIAADDFVSVAGQ